VLAEDFHLSYPNIFLGSDGKIYMLPETAASGRAWLYAADEFPFRWRKVRALIDQSLRDPSIIFTKDGVLLLGTTREDELRAYRAPSLDGNFSSEGTLITSDKAISRSGGAPFALGDKLHRPAQNCREFYGQNISIMEVENADSSGYSERMVKEDLFPRRPKWMQLGYHHMSVAKFGNDYFLAVDGRRKDKYINTILLAYFKLLGN
ncbi:MAG: hypothetical protein ABIR05_05525, partial [Luteimonas sp.]